jgi:hypothetical protein
MDRFFTEGGKADGGGAAQGGARAAGGHVAVSASSQRVARRNFKVLRLVKDHAAERRGEAAARCYRAEEHFTFDFAVYRDDDPAFDYSNPGYPAQSLYLSHDTTRLLEIVFEKGMAQVWRRRPADEAGLEAARRATAGGGAPPRVRWERHRVVPAYP